MRRFALAFFTAVGLFAASAVLPQAPLVPVAFANVDRDDDDEWEEFKQERGWDDDYDDDYDDYDDDDLEWDDLDERDWREIEEFAEEHDWDDDDWDELYDELDRNERRNRR